MDHANELRRNAWYRKPGSKNPLACVTGRKPLGAIDLDRTFLNTYSHEVHSGAVPGDMTACDFRHSICEFQSW